MLGHRALTVQDYTKILKKRWWIVAIPAILFAIVGYAITYFVKPQYISQALVLVEQQKVPENYVKPIVTEDLNARLATMREQILSRSRLQPIIEHFNLFADGKASMDDRIDQTRKSIDIKTIQSDIARTNGVPGFFIFFKANDPRTAQLVCGEILSLFITESLNNQAAYSAGATDFLKGELADAKAKLDEQAAALAKFQQSYAGKLPGAEASNMNMMTTLNTQLDAANQALSRLQQQRDYAESMLELQQSQSAQTVTTHGGTAAAPQELQQQLQQLMKEEAELSGRYTDENPDVVSVRRKIADIRQQIASAPAPVVTPSTSTPKLTDSIGVQQVRAQIRAIDAEIAQKKKDQAATQGQLRMYQERISSSPEVQAQYEALTRDNATARTFYEGILNNMNQSKMATDLEKRQQGEHFTTLDEPNLPESPAYPKRGVFVGGGLGAGLALGLLIVGVLEYLDTALRSENDIWAFTKLPTLGVIAYNGSEPQVKAKRRWFGLRGPDLTADAKTLVNTGG